jgi:hypothetical protein
MRMPGTTGIELHQKLVNGGHAIPTILITAYPDETVRARAIRAGIRYYLPKPVTSDALLACVDEAPGGVLMGADPGSTRRRHRRPTHGAAVGGERAPGEAPAPHLGRPRWCRNPRFSEAAAWQRRCSAVPARMDVYRTIQHGPVADDAGRGRKRWLTA